MIFVLTIQIAFLFTQVFDSLRTYTKYFIIYTKYFIIYTKYFMIYTKYFIIYIKDTMFYINLVECIIITPRNMLITVKYKKI